MLDAGIRRVGSETTSLLGTMSPFTHSGENKLQIAERYAKLA